MPEAEPVHASTQGPKDPQSRSEFSAHICGQSELSGTSVLLLNVCCAALRAHGTIIQIFLLALTQDVAVSDMIAA